MLPVSELKVGTNNGIIIIYNGTHYLQLVNQYFF